MTEDLAPSGVLDTVEIADELSRMKATKHTFAYFDSEDISQEIWLAIHKASGRFDPSRVRNKNLSFFNVVTENALKNLKRDRRIIDNVNLSTEPSNPDTSFEDELAASELYEYIKMNLDGSLHDALDRIIFYGGEGVSSYTKTKIRKSILDILEGYDG